MDRQGIAVYFNPFTIESYPEWETPKYFEFKRNNEKLIGIPEVEWCDLPDILYSEDTSQFVGFSFRINNPETCKEFFLNLTRQDKGCGIKYLQTDMPEYHARYSGVSGHDYLELLLTEPPEHYTYDYMASIAGDWLYTQEDVELGNESTPRGFAYFGLESLKKSLQLV